MLRTDVAPGVHLVEHAGVNCWLVEDDDGVTLVDAGLPGVWRELGEAIRQIGRRPGDLRAIVLTHAHFDHVGVAERLRKSRRLPVWVDEADSELAAHPYRYAHERPRSVYPIRHPRAVPILLRMAGAGALRVRGVAEVRTTAGRVRLDVPGRPEMLPTPGHTWGHCAILLPGRDAVLSGDALVTLDPYTGERGPRIVAGAATADSELALESLETLAATGVTAVLPGHGEPWLGGVRAAVETALRTGPS